MTYGISYRTLVSQSQEIGENSCLTIWKMALTIQSNKQKICAGMSVILVGTVIS